MTQEEKLLVAKILRKETACGLMEANVIIDQLVTEMKKKPAVIMDNPAIPRLTIEWERKYDTGR